MRYLHLKLILLLLFVTLISSVWGQPKSHQPTSTLKENNAVVITGVRFSYPLIQKWIDDYNKTYPASEIIIESRGTSDPASYDILIEAFDQDEAYKKTHDFLYVAKYPIVPVANSQSAFAKFYDHKGLNRRLITQLFFHDITADKDKEQDVPYHYTIYNRLQRAGAPIVFTEYFGFTQKDIRGKAVAGSDEHLLKSILRDTLAVSYLPLTLAFEHNSGKVVSGLTILPVDIDGNGKVSDDEKFYTSQSVAISSLESRDAGKYNNLPVGYLHFSTNSTNPKPEAVAFLKWVALHGQGDLAAFGYLKPLSVQGNAEVFSSHLPE